MVPCAVLFLVGDSNIWKVLLPDFPCFVNEISPMCSVYIHILECHLGAVGYQQANVVCSTVSVVESRPVKFGD